MTQDTVLVQIPPPADGAGKSWAKLVSSVDPARERGRALDGVWLDRGALYEVFPGTGVVLTYDLIPGEGHKVTFCRVTADGDLKELGSYTRKEAWATQTMIDRVGKWLAKNPWRPPGLARQITQGPNQWERRCDTCRETVPAGAGRQTRNASGRLIVRHLPGGCPPPPVLPNRYPGPCDECGGWLDAGEGRFDVITIVDPYQGRVDRKRIRHLEVCPPPEDRKPRPAPPPEPDRPNTRPGQCWECGTALDTGQGLLVRRPGYRYRKIHCRQLCPDAAELAAAVATLTVSTGEGYGGKPRTRGQVVRVSWTPGRDPVWDAMASTGLRIHADGSHSAVCVAVRATSVYHRDEGMSLGVGAEAGHVYTTVYRPATDAEAAEYLTREWARDWREALVEAAQRDLIRAADRQLPDPEETSGVLRLPAVRVAPRRAGLDTLHPAFHHLRVDHERGLVWLAQYNGADGDDWGISNCGNHIVWRMPMTPARAALVAALLAEFGTPTAQPAEPV